MSCLYGGQVTAKYCNNFNARCLLVEQVSHTSDYFVFQSSQC